MIHVLLKIWVFQIGLISSFRLYCLFIYLLLTLQLSEDEQIDPPAPKQVTPIYVTLDNLQEPTETPTASPGEILAMSEEYFQQIFKLLDVVPRHSKIEGQVCLGAYLV